MSQIQPSCAFPLCHHSEESQTYASRFFRITAIALASIAVLIGTLILLSVPGLVQCGFIAGGILVSTGILLTFLAMCIRCVKQPIDTKEPITSTKQESSSEEERANTEPEQVVKTEVKSDTKNSVQIEEIPLEGQEGSISHIAFGNGKIASSSDNKTIVLWSTQSGKCEIKHRNSPHKWNHIALGKDALLLVYYGTVYIYPINQINEVVFKTTIFENQTYPYCFAIHESLIAAAVGKTKHSIQIWSWKHNAKLYDFQIDREIKQLSIYNKTLACICSKNDKCISEVVYILSLETGKVLHTFSVEQLAAVYQDYILCVDKAKTTIYSINGDMVTTFPQEIVNIKKFLIINNLFILLKNQEVDIDSGVYTTEVQVLSMKTGLLLYTFDLGNDWIGEDMGLDNEQVIICGTFCSSNKADQNKANMWKLNRKELELGSI